MLQKSKCSIFHNIFKYMIFKGVKRRYYVVKGLSEQTWEVLVLITLPSNKGSGEPAQTCRLTREFTAHVYKSMDVDEDSDQNLEL